MASLGDVQKAELQANETINDYSSRVKSLINSLSDINPNGGMRVLENTIIGINLNTGLDNMDAAIDNYCNAVTDILNEFNTAADPHNAFAGQFVEELQEFVNGVKGSCYWLVDSLKTFKTDLHKVADAMKAKDAQISQGVSETTASVKSETWMK